MIERLTRKNVSSYKVVTSDSLETIRKTKYFKRALNEGLKVEDFLVGTWESIHHTKTYRVSIGDYYNVGSSIKEAFSFCWFCFKQNGTAGKKLQTHVDGRRGRV